jgi:hypothetical protein
MSVIDNHNRFTRVQTSDGRRIRINNHSGEIEEIAFDSLDTSPVAVPVAENVTLLVLDVLQPAEMPESVTDLATVIRDKKFKSKF